MWVPKIVRVFDKPVKLIENLRNLWSKKIPMSGYNRSCGTLVPVSIDLCTVRRDGAPDFRRIYVPIFGIMTILIKSGAPGFSSGAHFLQGWLAQGHISQKKRK